MSSTFNIASESDLDTAIAAANGVGGAAGVATEGDFTANVTQTAAPTPIEAGNASLLLNGAGNTLTGDGAQGALIVQPGGQVTLENITITQTGTASAAITTGQTGSGGSVTFTSGDGTGADSTGDSTVNGFISGIGTVHVGTGQEEQDFTTTFNGANTYTGATIITGSNNATSTLALGAGGSIASSIQVIENYGILDISAVNGSGAATTVSVNNLQGAHGSVVLGGNTLVVNESVNDANSAYYGGSISGTGGLTVQTGQFNFQGAGTYTGSTKIYGTLAVVTGDALSASSNVSLKQSGAKLDLTGVEGRTININELTGVAGSILKIGQHTLVVNENVVDASFSGVIHGQATLEVEGPNTLTLLGVNDYSRGTIINGGHLALAGAGTLGVAGGTLTLENAGTLDVSAVNGGAVTLYDLNDDNSGTSVNLGATKLTDSLGSGATDSYYGDITGTGSLQVGATSATAQTGALTLGGENDYTGSTIVYGTLALGADGSISNSSNVSLTVTGATFDITDATAAGTYTDPAVTGSQATTRAGVAMNELTGVAGTHVHLGGNTLLINETTNATFSGVIDDSGNGSGIVVRGSATLTLAGANTYSGATVIKGDLAIGAGGSITNSAVHDYGVFDISNAGGDVTIKGLYGSNANATINLGANTLDIENNYQNGGFYSYGFAGAISGSGGLTVGATANAYLYLDGANTFTGATTIGAGGYLEINQGGSLASTSIVDNGGLDYYVSSATVSAVISGTGYLEVDSAYDDSIAVRDYTGDGLLTLTGANTYTGGTYIYGDDSHGATLAIGAGGSIASSSGVYFDNGSATLDITNAGGNVTVKGVFDDAETSAITLGANTLVINGTNTTSNFDGVISGAGGVQVGLGDTLTLSGVNTYTGSTVVYGTLDIIDAGSVAASSNVSLKGSGSTGASFNIANATGDVSIQELTGQTGTTVVLGAHTLSVNETIAASYSGVISGSGGLTVGGSQYLTLAGANTYTGVTTITGSLQLGVNGSISTSSKVIDNGFLALAANATVNDLSGTGVVKMVTNTLTDTATGTARDMFSGVIHGAGVFTYAGADTGGTGNTGTSTHLTLSGASDYSGGTVISGGTLEIAATTSAGSGTINLSATATGATDSVLQIDTAALSGVGTASQSFANAITGTHGAGMDNIIDLTGLTYSSSNAAQAFTVTTAGQVSVLEGNVTVTLNVTDAAVGDVYHFYADSHGGTYITQNMAANTDATHYHP